MNSIEIDPPIPAALDSIELLVKSVTHEAQGINVWEFCRPDRGLLPAFTAGAHIDLRLSNGMVRSYSLCNSQDERHRYAVAISRDPLSRGGSKLIHETLTPGDRIQISAPRNNFPLVEDAEHSVFVAGGIGITPIWCMIQRLEKLGRTWELHYSARRRDACAFRQTLEAREEEKPGRVHFNFDEERGGRMTDLRALIATVPEGVHVYCCGSAAMLRAFEEATAAAGIPQQQVHVEYFSAKEAVAANGGFTVVLRRTGKSFAVPPGKTILDTLLDNNVAAPSSCLQGVCGTCEATVLDGVPDHRDSVLTPAERAANKTMMICCSGSKSPELVLDL